MIPPALSGPSAPSEPPGPTAPPEPPAPSPVDGDRVWYVSYGSNMHLARLVHYLDGGRPPGGARTYPGCRDPRRPARSVAVELPGSVYFAHESAVWTGGMAFYDPDASGQAWARAHLLTAGQFADIAAQEMHRPPGQGFDLSGVLADGRAVLGPGRYETLVCPGTLDGHPLLTFTSPWSAADAVWNRPVARYLRHVATGLLEAGAWDVPGIARYLAGRPGVAGAWRAEQVAALVGGLQQGRARGEPGPAAGAARVCRPDTA